MYSTKFLSFLGYIRIESGVNKSFYTFPIPIITEELNSTNTPFILGLECPDPELTEFIADELLTIATNPDSYFLGVADIQLAPHIICPFLYIKLEHLLLTAPIYIYSSFIRNFILNSKLLQNSTLQIEFYSGNIEILTIKLHEIFEPKSIIGDYSTSYSKYPLYSSEELSNYINGDTFAEISYSLMSLISESE
jgi:hypothetical protein